MEPASVAGMALPEVAAPEAILLSMVDPSTPKADYGQRALVEVHREKVEP